MGRISLLGSLALKSIDPRCMDYFSYDSYPTCIDYERIMKQDYGAMLFLEFGIGVGKTMNTTRCIQGI